MLNDRDPILERGKRRRKRFWRRIALVPRFDIWAGSSYPQK
jgi:hypothetical protein